MTNESLLTSSTASEIQMCQHRTASGRHCRMLVSKPGASLCHHHAASQSKDQAKAAVATRLIGETGEFRSAVEINRSLGELYKLLARDEIAPRRAAVMAYTCNLLLRTLPAIDRELHPPNHEDPIVLDIPSYVAQRALEARLAQDAAQRTQDAQRLALERISA
ncbi:MAG TPA: hypothetical protein VEI73_01840 [Candidatus Acidoferrum sp.]|nr:hypothetical protein [Candidatus Acidoferrum sp.]